MRKKTTYIIIDRSGSMNGARADAVNLAMQGVMRDVLPEVLSQKDADMEPMIAVLTYSSDGIDWYVPKTKMEDVKGDWLPIDASKFYGGTPTGEAIAKVIEDINTGDYGEPDPDAVPPAIILISDGMPNGQNPSYEEVLQRAEKDHVQYCADFRHANRIAIGIQVDATGRESLKAFGRVSSSIASMGFEPYYDCTDDNLQALVAIIKSCTLGATVLG